MNRDRTYDPNEGEFVDFETLADWEDRDKAKDARIEALERQVKAADALIEDLLQHEGAEGFSQSTDELQAAYRATKEGGV